MSTTPTTELTDGATLLSLLGSHWSSIYDGQQTVADVLQSNGMLAQQVENNMLETAACVAIETVPVWHRERMMPLILKESELNANLLGALLYDDAEQLATYDDARGYEYGSPVNRLVYSFPIDSGIHSIAAITDGSVSCNMSLVWQLDFSLDSTRRAISFFDNPFDNSRLKTRTIFDDEGNPIRTLELWMWAVDVDQRFTYMQFGHLVASEFSSSETYRKFVVAAMRSLRLGAGRKQIEQIAEAATGIRLAQSNETVRQLLEFNGYKFAITDLNVYRFKSSALWLVAVGDSLIPGQSIVDTVRLVPARSSSIPAGVLGFCLSRGLLDPRIIGSELFFYNKEVPFNSVTRYGKQFAEFELSGDAADVAAFWNHVHGQNTPYEDTLAYLIDSRVPKSNNTRDAVIPATINPCKFLFDNLLSVGVSWLSINWSDCDGGIGLQAFNLIRDILPPWLLLAIQVTINAGEKIIDVDGIVGTTEIEGLYDEGYIGPNVPAVYLEIGPAMVTFQESSLNNNQTCG